MHLFTDSKLALREAVTRRSSRLSPLELILSPTNVARIQGASTPATVDLPRPAH
jgi:hypothetical protein